VFYGWWIVGGAFLISVYVGGAIFYGFTAFFEPIIQELGWSYAQVSLASSLRGLEAGLLAPVLGILVDRWGSRRLIFLGSIIAAAGLLLISRTSSLIVFYAAFALLSLGTSACTGIVVLTAVANWFQRKIGIANAIALCGFGFSGLLIPGIVKLIDTYGWRGAFVIVAVGMVVVVLPLSILFRHKPEHHGLLPDGAVESERSGPEPPPQPASGAADPGAADMGTLQALKSGIFWGLTALSVCHMVVMSATITHVMPYLSSIGLTRSVSGFVAAAIPVASIAGRLLFGWVGDRYGRRSATAAAFIMIGLGIFCFGFASSEVYWLLIPFVVLFGIGYGGSNTLRISLARVYFGRANFGGIFGLILGISVLGGIIAPPLAGWVFDATGSYRIIWFVYAALPFASLGTLATFPKTEDATSVPAP
jgi:MFS family permease